MSNVGITLPALCSLLSCSSRALYLRSSQRAPRVLCRLPLLPAGYMWPSLGFNLCLGICARTPCGNNPNWTNRFLIFNFVCFRVHVSCKGCNVLTLAGFCCLTCCVYCQWCILFEVKLWNINLGNTLELRCVVHFGSSVLGASCAPTLFLFHPRTDTPVFHTKAYTVSMWHLILPNPSRLKTATKHTPT